MATPLVLSSSRLGDTDDGLAVRLSPRLATHDVCLLGKTSMGKTSLITALFTQLVNTPGMRGVFIDPHGDVDVLGYVSPEQVARIVFFARSIPGKVSLQISDDIFDASVGNDASRLLNPIHGDH